jgi:polyferredoxin
MYVKPICLEAERNRKSGYLLNSKPPNYWIKPARRIVQLISLLISFSLFYFLAVLSLYYVIAAILILALASSILLGRAFCSWVCPFGTLYEFSRLWFNPKRLRPLCRFGCPYAFLMGITNRFSVFKIEKDDTKCTQCGICDDLCPVGLTDLGSSYQDFTSNPSQRYACIRCLTCVASCPQGALTFGFYRREQNNQDS